MRRYIVLLMLLFLFTSNLDAQLWQSKRWEAVGGIGPTLFFGDIGGFSTDENYLGFRDIGFKQIFFDINGSVRYRILRDLNVRMSLSLGKLHASDSRGSNVDRNFVSSTNYFEPMALGEYYFIKNKAENNYLFLKNSGRYVSALMSSLDFYVFTGLGANFFNVTGNEPLIERGMTEKGSAVILPLGLGTSFIYSPDLNFGIEFCGRYAFNDYLEGYSSQYSESNDVYYTINLTVTYKIRSQSNGIY